MSDPNAPENLPQADGTEPTAALPDGAEPTAVLPGEVPPPVPGEPAVSPAKGSGTRRTAIVAAVAVAVVAVLGGGAFGVYKVFFDGGPRPADVLPDTTVALLSLDLDPSAGQKIAALKTIRKFPQLKEDLGLDPSDDLRKYVVEELLECDDINFEDDVAPWIGKRAAIGAVDLGDDEPAPVIALQVTDQKKADAEFEKLAECSGEDLGYVVGPDYLIASDNAEHAQAILASGKQRPLADDEKYGKWTDEVGDQGVVNFYVSQRATRYLTDALDSLGSEFGGLVGDDFGGGTDPSDFGSEFDYDSEGGLAGESAPRAADECTEAAADPFTAFKEQIEKFDGMAGTIRFADGGMELSVAAGGFQQLSSSATVGDQVGSLPADTTLAAGFAVPKDYAKDLVGQLSCGAGDEEDLVAQIEEESGLQLPEDLTDLLGSAITLSLGGDAPEDLSSIEGPADIPIGLAIHGDTDAIETVIAKVEKHLGMTLEDELGIGLESSGSLLVASPSEDYTELLLGKGGLGSSKDFEDAVPEADRSAAILYLDFDSEWRDALLDVAGDEGVSESDLSTAEENTRPLKSLGISAWLEDGASHVLVKLSTR